MKEAAIARCRINSENFPVISLHGSEAISQLFEFETTISDNLGLMIPSEQLGNPATLSLQDNEGNFRQISGDICAIDYQADTATITLKPKLARGQNSQQTRLFLNKSRQQIVNQILVELGYTAHQINWYIDSTETGLHTTLLQAGESQLNFVKRLLAELQCFFWFDSHNYDETIHIANNLVQTPFTPPITSIEEQKRASLQGKDSPLTMYWQQALPAKFFNTYTRPALPISTERSDTKHIGYNSAYIEETHLPLPESARQSAELQSQQHQTANQAGFILKGSFPTVAPGFSINIPVFWRSDQGIDDLTVIHTVHFGEVFDAANPELGLKYNQTSKLIKRSSGFAPDFPTMPALPLMFPARIESNTKYAYLDEHGRYQLRMAFSPNNSEHFEHTLASPSIDRMIPFTNASQEVNTGWHYPLLDNSTVLVTLLNNDPNRPCILGFASEIGQNGPVNQSNAHQSRIVTPAQNELTFDDQLPNIILQTFDGQTKLELNAAGEQPFIQLAAQFGLVKLSAGQHQRWLVRENLVQKHGGSLLEKVKANSTSKTDGNSQLQAAKQQTARTKTDMTFNSTANQEWQAKSAGINIRSEAAYSITSKGAQLSKISDGNYRVQAPTEISFKGTGRGDMLITNGTGGFKIDSSGNIKLFGSTVSLKGGSDVTFFGDVEYELGASNEAEKAKLVKPKRVNDISSLELESFNVSQDELTPYERKMITRKKIEEVSETSDVKLASTFAVEQLQIIANKDSLAMFMGVFIDIFGLDIPAKAYEEIYLDAQSGKSILKPKIVVKKSISEGSGIAAFFNDGTKQEIWVSETMVRNAAIDNNKRGELMIILIEEYGHYLDFLLRNHYAETERPDALKDEGAKFAYNVLQINPLEQADQYFGDANIDGENVSLTWDFSELHNELKAYVNEERQHQDDIHGEFEFYKAGYMKVHGKYGHGDIEREALKDLLDQKTKLPNDDVVRILNTIYLGNWLRDFSQLVDPMTVRPMANVTDSLDSSSTAELTTLTTNNIGESHVSTIEIPTGVEPDGWFNFKTTWETVQFHPVMLSVEALTSVVELGAIKEFVHKKAMNEDNVKNYNGHISSFREEYLPITPDVLGVYRPEEHIDNPLGIGQNSKGGNRGDKDLYSTFVGHVPDEHELHNINKTFGMKNYIRSKDSFQVEGESFPTAYEYIVSQLKIAAIPNGLNNTEALVAFGAAMHTLEDYFAHTNYAEVTLIKSVEPFVFPWVDKVTIENNTFTYNYEDLFDGIGFNDRNIVLDDTKNLKLGTKPSNRLASYIPIVTGTFGMIDTAASVLPVLNHVLFNLELTPWEETKPGTRTFNDVLVLEILRDIDRSQGQDKSGTNDDSYASSFETLLSIRDGVTRVKNYLPDDIQKGFHWVTQRIGLMFKFTQYFLIKAVASNLKEAQVLLNKDLDMMELGTFTIGTNPSHTQVAKDDLNAPMHNLSAKLAVEAVKQVGEKMIDVWSGVSNLDEAIKVVDTIMRHPVTSTWQDEIVNDWSKNNRTEICLASTPSAIIDRTLHAIDEMEETFEEIEDFLDNPETVKTIEKLEMYFSGEDESEISDHGVFNAFINASRKKSKEQRVRAKTLKFKWDKKYPKPNNCKSTEYAEPKEQREYFKYKIEKGNTLESIAKRFSCSINELKELNKLTSDTIYAGNYILVPKLINNSEY
ncbi:LysM peptidoglycan-binding domain-containing protein [Reinekea forsetii]|nr:LysM peptidoglycan-binding domain-containing protein [Reinekea forsetii]